MGKPELCLKCKEIITFCECDNSITDKDEYIEYLEQLTKDGLKMTKTQHWCKCRFAMIQRNQKTQKAYCFECKKEIVESRLK